MSGPRAQGAVGEGYVRAGAVPGEAVSGVKPPRPPVLLEDEHKGVPEARLGDVPVSCLNYCKARMVNYNPGDFCEFDNGAYADWGEIASFYTHPAERGKGYGGLLFEEACRRMKLEGFPSAFVFVLQENEGARPGHR